MDKFSVGEIAIGQNFVDQKQWNGMECEIIGSLQLCTSINLTTREETTAPRYAVKWADGFVSYQEPIYLRKRHQPQKQKTTTWDKCVWQPNELIDGYKEKTKELEGVV